jgi:hypothetical protein
MTRPAVTLTLASVIGAPLLAATTAQPTAEYGNSPALPQPQRGLLPTVGIADPATWNGRKVRFAWPIGTLIRSITPPTFR